MRILCKTTFLHGRERFEQGDTRTVDDDLGAYFVKSGWAQDLSTEVSGSAVEGSSDLDIQSSVLGTGDSNG